MFSENAKCVRLQLNLIIDADDTLLSSVNESAIEENDFFRRP